MYRIELSPGEETAFRSIEELAVAIRRKVVTSRARIYHNATGRWLPIQFHPHYKIALTMPLTQADLVAGPPVTPLSKLKLGESQSAAAPPALSNREGAAQAAMAAWPEPKPGVPAQPLGQKPREEVVPPRIAVIPAAPEPPLRRAVDPRAIQPAHNTEPEPRSVTGRTRIRLPLRRSEYPSVTRPATNADTGRAQHAGRRRKPKRHFRVALAGAVLIACAHLLVSTVAVPSTEPPGRPRTPRQLVRVPAEANVAPRTVAAVMPGIQSIPVPGFPAPGISNGIRTTAESSTLEAGAQPTLLHQAAGDSVAAMESGLEAAPDPAGLVVNGPVAAESLAPPVVDSSGKKALKGILRTISGSPAPGVKPPKR